MPSRNRANPHLALDSRFGLDGSLQESNSAETKRAKRRSRSLENLTITSAEGDDVPPLDLNVLQFVSQDNLRVTRRRHNSVVANSKESVRLSTIYGWVTPAFPSEISTVRPLSMLSPRKTRSNSISPAEGMANSLGSGLTGNHMRKISFQDSLVDSTIVESKPSSASQQPEQMMDYFSVGLASSVAPSDESPISSEMHPNTPTRPTSTRLPSYLEDLVKGGLSNRSNRRSSVSSSSTPKADKWAGIFSLRRKSIVNDVNDVPPRSRSASFPSLHFSTSTSKSKQRPADGLASPPSPSEQEPFQGRNKVDSGYLSFSSVDSNTNVMSGLDAIHDLDDLDEHLESPIGSPRPLHPYDPSPPISETDISVFDRLRIDTAEVIQFADGNGRVVGSGNVENDLPAEFSLITAATVEKLVEKLTKDIDYTFMTDFFLTFRLFLSPVRLCKLLILRFRWALQGDLEEHQLVRIRTFVVIRHWLTFYFTQDFITSRTLRFMTTTFLNDMRMHPVILSSQRDERIIRSLRTVLKKQRKTYMDRSEGDALVLESQHHGVAERPGPSRTGLSGTRQRLQRALTSLPGSIMTGQAALNASKDSDKASKTSFMSSKNSASSSGTSLSPRRAAPTTSQRSVRESNAWSLKMTFGISSIKRKVPAMYQSIVNSKNLSASSIVEPECRPEGCCCSVDIMQASKSTSTVMIDENESWRTSPKSGAVSGSPGSRNGSLFRMKTGKNFGTLTSRGSASDDSISSIKFVEEPTSMEPENLRPSILRAFSSPPSQNRPSKVTRSITSQDSMVLVHTNPSCPFFDADQLPTQSGATPLSSSNELLPIHGILGEFSLPNSPTLSPQMPYRSFVLLYRSEVIAQQFCILERRLLRDVTWEELIELRWTKKKPEHSVNEEMEEPKKKRGVDALIERFDSVCQWVTSEIVRTKSIDLRVKVVEKFIRIALKCYHQRNYSTLTQLLIGLQSPLISRLHRTWRRVDNYELHILHDLQDLVKPFKNWKNIRDAMRKACDEIGEVAAVEECLTKRIERDGDEEHIEEESGEGKGCIPFLGVYLSDLIYNAELPSYIYPSMASTTHIAPNEPAPNSPELVNFHKHRITASVIKHVLAFKILSVRYTLDIDSTVFLLVEHLVYLDAAELREASMVCEV